MMLAPRRSPGADPLHAALQPWLRRLGLESLARWLLRGGIGALLVAVGVLVVGWLVPIAESELRPVALVAGLPVLALAAVVGVWPTPTLDRAWQLDVRLGLAERLTTAWLQRGAGVAMAELQRKDALTRLAARSPERELPLRWRRLEVGALIGVTLAGVFFALAPSPMQSVLDRQAAEAGAVRAASERLEALRQEVASASTLSPEQAQHVDELLQQARADLSRTTSEQEAQRVLAGTAQKLTRLGDEDADAREEALGAMSETLSQEPLTRALGDALARNDASATAQAAHDLTSGADQLSDVERQALGRALQRAANVGRGDPRSSAALRNAAQALNDGTSAQASLDASSEALREALQAVSAQATLRSTSQRLQDLEAAMGRGAQPRDTPLTGGATPSNTDAGLAQEPGRPVAVDPIAAGAQDAPGQQQTGAGRAAADLGASADAVQGPVAAENVFVPGIPNDGPSARDLVQQPFTVRGAPRPYREVLGQYAQAGRDYVDRADVAPSVRELVKQYFAKLEEDQ